MKPQNIFLVFLVCLSVALTVVFFLTMFIEGVENHLYKLSGVAKGGKLLLLQSIGILIGGVFVASQALASYIRGIAMEKTAAAQADSTGQQARANVLIEQGQRQERLKAAIDHLGHLSSSVRLGGAYELVHLARETEDLRGTVLDVLCAHVRQTTTTKEYRENHHSKPSAEIQILVTTLFVQNICWFKGLRAHLQGSVLNGANLANSYLVDSNMEGVQLHGANLHNANLQGVTLLNANLSGVFIAQADLSGARIFTSNMQRAIVVESHVRGATIIGTAMHFADFRQAEFQGSQMREVHMQGANVTGSNFQGVRPIPSVVRTSGHTSLAFVHVVQNSIEKMSDLSQVFLEGGLREEHMSALVAGLSKEEGQELRREMGRHLGKPGTADVAEEAGVVSGIYTAKDASKWIAGYRGRGARADRSAGVETSGRR